MYINRPDELAVGLFANTYNENYSNLHIKNVILVEPNIIGNKYVGALIGYVNGTTYERHHTIQNIQVVGGSIKGNEYVGGIAGYINAGSYIKGLQAYRHIFDNLYNSASVEASNYAGGIVGLLMNIDSYGAVVSPIKMSNMLNMGSITSNSAGGFVGYIKTRVTNEITISESINTGIISGTNDSNNIFGYFDTTSDGNLNLTNVYYIGDSNLNVENEKIKVNNVSGKNISGLKNTSNYSDWPLFTSNWKIEPIDEILRFPILNIVNDFKYTNLSVTELELNLSSNVNLYDLIDPKERVFFETSDDSIVSVDDSGNLIINKAGEITVKISSYYDGFERYLKIIISKHMTKITFESNGGSPVDEIAEYAGEKILKPEDPKKDNYNFEGWYTDNGTFRKKYEFDLMPRTDITLYAKWSRIKSGITFESNGGTEVSPIIGFAGEIIFSPKDPEKTNYRFEGWYIDNETFETKFEFELMPETNTVLYAKWSRIESRITFNSNGGTSIDPIIKYAGEEISKPSDPEKTNYTFGGWYIDNGTFETKYEFELMPDDDIVLYAKWINIESKITFNSNGGTEVAPIIGNVGEKVVKPDDPKRENYNFKGWYIDNGTFETKYEFDLMPETNIILYAKWEQTFSYKINEYTIDNELNIIDNIPLGTTKENYEKNIILNDNYTYKLNVKDAVINTGSTLQIYYNDSLYYEYTNLIRGDVDGDGKLSLSDIMKTANYIYMDKNSLKGIYLKAADYNNDMTYNLQDIMKIANRLYG